MLEANLSPNLITEEYIERSRKPTTELFCGIAVNYFRQKGPSFMFVLVLNTLLNFNQRTFAVHSLSKWSTKELFLYHRYHHLFSSLTFTRFCCFVKPPYHLTVPLLG